MNRSGFYIFRFCIAALILSILSQCASPGSIQGGPKDETPPKVDSLASSPTPQVNFTKDDITITFDEWVKLEDPFDQIGRASCRERVECWVEEVCVKVEVEA